MRKKKWLSIFGLLLIVMVIAVGCGSVNKEINDIKSSTSAPSAPTGVTATPGNGQVTIAWTAVSGAITYNIYWSTTAGTGQNGTQILAATNPYTQTGLTNGTPYYYVVTAVNLNGESTPSAQVSATPSAQAPITLSGVLYDNSGTSPVIAPGLQITARHPTDIDNSNSIAQATTLSDGSFSLIVPYGSDLYLNVSGTSGGTQYVSGNYCIWNNLTASPNLGPAGVGVGALPLSSINNILNSSTCGGSPCSASGIAGKGWLALDAFDAATMSNHIAGVSFAVSPAVAFFGYNNNSNGTTYIAPPTQAATLAETISGGWNGPSVWGYNDISTIVTVTASKSGSPNQIYECPIIPGELTYQQLGF